jgi:hypothetical protein
VIRALRACLRRPDLRRIVGVVALLAFVLVVVLGAAHAGEKHAAGHDHCGICDAVAAIGTSESFAAPQLTAQLAACDAVAAPDAAAPFAAEPRRSHAPRGPPSLA